MARLKDTTSTTEASTKQSTRTSCDHSVATIPLNHEGNQCLHVVSRQQAAELRVEGSGLNQRLENFRTGFRNGATCRSTSNRPRACPASDRVASSFLGAIGQGRGQPTNHKTRSDSIEQAVDHSTSEDLPLHFRAGLVVSLLPIRRACLLRLLVHGVEVHGEGGCHGTADTADRLRRPCCGSASAKCAETSTSSNRTHTTTKDGGDNDWQALNGRVDDVSSDGATLRNQRRPLAVELILASDKLTSASNSAASLRRTEHLDATANTTDDTANGSTRAARQQLTSATALRKAINVRIELVARDRLPVLHFGGRAHPGGSSKLLSSRQRRLHITLVERPSTGKHLPSRGAEERSRGGCSGSHLRRCGRRCQRQGLALDIPLEPDDVRSGRTQVLETSALGHTLRLTLQAKRSL